MEFDKIVQLIWAVSDSKLTQFTLEEGNLKISMKTDKKKTMIALGESPRTEQKSEYVPVETKNHPEEQAPREDVSGNVVTSPLVGTFYNSPAPDAESFVKVGDRVKKGQILGIIEAMKLMNEIESEYEGTIERILVDNEQVVEYGQPLFVIDQEV